MNNILLRNSEERILVLAPTLKDAQTTQGIFKDAHLQSFICRDVAELCREMKNGAGALLVTQEAIFHDDARRLGEALKEQPAWSDYPLIVLTPAGAESPRVIEALSAVGNMTLMKRPVQISALISAMQTALRDRKRQYRIRDLIVGYELATQKAEMANQAKSNFLANMSHEIRTPMNAIVGLTDLLSRANISEEKRQEFLSTLKLSAQSLLELINDLLDISKIENESVELEKIPFDLHQLLQEAVSIIALRTEEKDIALRFEYDPLLHGYFVGDPHRLKQIVTNLIGNAVKFMEKGSVTLRVKAVAAQSPDIVFDVIDTGIGIAENKLQDIFGKFSQADSSITRKYGGTGLGLAITKTLVGIMGGTIDVTSQQGCGSTFTVRIPLTRSGPVQESLGFQSGDSVCASGHHALRVLLVEDSQANIMVAETILQNLGHHCEIAHNGAEALVKLKDKNFDVVLMDVQMPVLDGYSATRIIRQEESQRNAPKLPIIGITAHALAGDREKCLQAGMNDYIAKPFRQNELEGKLSHILRIAA